MSNLRKTLNFLDENLEACVAFVLFSVMLVTLTVQVILRYVFSRGMIWPEEMARYAFQWVIYLGVSLAMKADQHIRIDAALGLWPRKTREAIKIISDLVVIAFGLYLIYGGTLYAAKIFRQGSYGIGFPIELGYVYTAIPVGYALMCFRTVQKIYKRVKGLKGGDAQPEGN